MGIDASKSRAAALVCLVAGLLPLVVAPSLPGCCAGIGCANSATVPVPVADDEVLGGATVTACFNDACVVSAALPASVPAKSGLGFAFPDGSNVSGTVWATDVNSERLEVSWRFPDGTKLGAGDRYRVTVTASSGDLIADEELTALAYHKSETCSSACYTARFR